MKGTRPMTHPHPPRIEPNGRFSHTRLSESGRMRALPPTPSIGVEEDGPRGGVSPCGAFGHLSLLTSEQVSRLAPHPLPIKERLGFSPVLNLSRLISCGSLSLWPACSSRSASTPLTATLLRKVFRREQPNSTDGTFTRVSASFAGATLDLV